MSLPHNMLKINLHTLPTGGQKSFLGGFLSKPQNLLCKPASAGNKKTIFV